MGIGVNAAVFGVLYRVVLKPLPFPESERLVQLKVRVLGTGQAAVHLTAREFESLSTGGEGFERVPASPQDKVSHRNRHEDSGDLHSFVRRPAVHDQPVAALG